MPSRTPETCPFRSGGLSGRDPKAACALLKTLIKLPGEEHCQVRLDACRACCQSFPPSETQLNPVVASLLVAATSGLLSSGQIEDAQRERLKVVREFGWEHVPEETEIRLYESATKQPDKRVADLSIEEILPPPGKRCKPHVSSWAVGMTTAPRRESTLGDSLQSLAGAGWDRICLFVDGDVEVPKEFAGQIMTRRTPSVGAWPNFYLSLLELLMRFPFAEAFLMVQDDVVFPAHPGVRGYLERVFWPGNKPGLVSLFCPDEYTHVTSGWHQYKGTWFWGAQAFVFSRNAAQKFAASDFVVGHRWHERTQGLANIDWLIGEWAARNRVPVYYPTPSLVQHVGRTSAIWNTSQLTGNRLACRFIGDAMAKEVSSRAPPRTYL